MWTIRTDGLMCVAMISRTGCRFWFRRGSVLANANTNEPDAPLVVQIQFE
jgi:hypothetical protein